MLLSWCGWHIQVYAIFMKMLTWACWYEAFVAMAEGKRCHGGETEMVPRQHSGPDNSWRYRCKRKCDVSESCKMVGWSRITGFPRVDDMANEEELARTNGHGANTSISYNTHNTGGRLIVIPLKRAFRGGSSSKRCRGSSCSRAVVEVVVLATVVEVDVHGSSWEVVVHGGGGSCSGSCQVVV